MAEPERSFRAVYERDPESDAWLVHVKGIDGCHTYGRSRRDASDVLGISRQRVQQLLAP